MEKPDALSRPKPEHPLLRLHATALAHQDDNGRPVSGASTRAVLLGDGRRARSDTAAQWVELNSFIQNTPERVWLLSDLHIGHANIIRYTDRPHVNVDSMNADLLNALDAIPDDDWLMVLGDVSMGLPGSADSFLARLPTRSALVFGNHDIQRGNGCRKIRDDLQAAFSARAEAWAVETPGRRLLFTHYPIPPALLPADVINLHGHTHNLPPLSPRHRNVCVEHTGYRPLCLADAIRIQPSVPSPSAPRFVPSV